MAKTETVETKLGQGHSPEGNSDGKSRCPWAAGQGDEQSRARMRLYHDREWGVPLHDERRHFEFLLLETFQAGLSWQCILNRREGFRAAFAAFDPVRVAVFGRNDVERLLQDSGIIRNRSKIEGTIQNARCFLEVQQQWGNFDAYIWHFTEGKSLQNSWREAGQVPVSSPLAEKVAGDLKQRGFCRVGAVTIYAHLQAIGVIQDHLQSCFRYRDLAETQGSVLRSPSSSLS
ncbi:DNA-3-methyladenine glycosylase I [Candidatus Haliotispira prima]|uniref:DNA-3-methyladenine glycosylase I n=1 Tax=Candidatus Haliotispira prima TaxID=3034016 RepID=A0ABY8MKK6_9SPIO|nr:DNA-3-methyladenine glycosylase I [Candidatus Haliotispira prima]